MNRISLVSISLLIGLIWRLEVDYRGWHGLIWTGYFHLAVPAGILIFVAWLYFNSKRSFGEKRAHFCCTSLLLACLTFLAGDYSMRVAYDRWWVLQLEMFTEVALNVVPFFVYLGAGVCFFGLIRMCHKIPWNKVAIVAALYIGVYPLAGLIPVTLALIDNQNVSDIVKYGYMFPISSLPYLIYLGAGACYFALIRVCGQIAFKSTMTGAAIYVCAFPVAVILLYVTGHKGGADILHAIKSGFVFPLICFSLGLPFVMGKYTLASISESPARKSSTMGSR